MRYTAADLFDPPPQWIRAFDFVLESYTLQVLPPELRERAMPRLPDFVHYGGHLLIITRARGEEDAPGQMPWPLTRNELDAVTNYALQELSFEDYFDRESPPVRRFRALYRRVN